tara:strand:- start:287 stop:1240 length:954 start_codon:yes stop_codon:yes gene_type:complete
MIIVTGGAGFIGSNVINYLSNFYLKDLISVDWDNEKNSHYFKKSVTKISPEKLEVFLKKNSKNLELIIHLGAITSTTERNVGLINKNNLQLSMFLWSWCVKHKKRFIYASSAATYGNGSKNFDDLETDNYLSELFPLNIYGWSKHIFDRFVIKQKKKPPQYVGLKFFNVYGPNEYHKRDMKSIALKIFEKIQTGKKIKLFKSHNPNYKDGEQLRDFIYVKDVLKIILWFIKKSKVSGIFNVGTGIPRSFNDLAHAVFKNTNKKKNLSYINTPYKIRDQYQYFTKANIKKLREVGFKDSFFSLEDGIRDYIRNYLYTK